MQLSVIIVNYNVRHFLEQCLLSVRKSIAGLANPEEVEIFVVDNNSVDESVAMVQEKFPEIKLIANRRNTGFAVANNQAIRQSSGKYVLLLNPDTVVREDTFRKCFDFMEAHPQAGGLGVKMIDGSGKFLPESKRGFPSPFVAFCKTFGLSKIFSKSRLFNRYHLGYLDPGETNEVDVLAGAFMLLRRSTLDKTGLLDEAFFMYGEDIDLSYRIVQAGYKNYYFAGTTIIHYKGESTKKGSLNYVRTFYNAMLIFARKHFRGRQARVYIAMIHVAIYLRAGMTLLGNFFKKSYLPLFDAGLIFGGLVFLKNFWATYYYHDPGYYEATFLYFNVPIYTILWLGAIFFTGGYDETFNLRRLTRGLLFGTLFLAAVYAFLPLQLRPSRAIILMGAAWAMFSLATLRTAIHFFKTGNLNVGKSRPDNLVIVGSEEESERVRHLLAQAGVLKNFIGTVANVEFGMWNAEYQDGNSTFRIPYPAFEQVVEIFKVDEVIFCSRDISSEEIMFWMSKLGSRIDYKIVPRESLSIIGSSSKDTAGELYTIDIRFQIATPLARRNKRVFDVMLSICLLLLSFLLVFFVKNAGRFLKNIFLVLVGKKSWVGYAEEKEPETNHSRQLLPSICSGVLSPLDALGNRRLDGQTVRQLNFLYAKDYEVWRDVEIVWKGAKHLGGRGY
jgi:GT2 family glycosyltransferase